MAKPKTFQTPWHAKPSWPFSWPGWAMVPGLSSYIHYVVVGGAWSRADNAWHPSRPDFHVPSKALSRIYQAKFRDLMRGAGMIRLIDPAVFRGTLEKVRRSIEMMHGFDRVVSKAPRDSHEKTGPIRPDCGGELRYRCTMLPRQMPGYRGSG